MGQLIVRRLDDHLIQALRIRAAEKGRSAEAEHREILKEALAPGRKPGSLKDLLLKIPNVGKNSDFDRPRDLGRRVRL